MGTFERAYQELNSEQRQAVDAIDGPVLVIAGPGTGKTQLLSLRVANIMKQTDTAASNILCLTFTDNAARNMRERLETIIGQDAYHIAIHTFHGFGAEVINQYGDYFSERQLLQQIDELGRYHLLRAIFEGLPHSNPLSVRVGDDFIYLKDCLELISWFKQNALSAVELTKLLEANSHYMEAVSDSVTAAFLSSPSPKLLPKYEQLLTTLQDSQTGKNYYGFPEYGVQCSNELALAIAETKPDGRYAPQITAWRNRWCLKNSAGEHVIKDSGLAERKMSAVVAVYGLLHTQMQDAGLYDFDDMIIEVVHAIESNAELRFALQERYQYVLVDEFQDTNKAQLRMLVGLGDNPVFENRPNIITVGDDDQAIYAFQGAAVSNMVAFYSQYDSPTVITLKDNYRSSRDILDASFAVAEQIDDRLESVIANAHTQLQTHRQTKGSSVHHQSFSSELAQYDWLADCIADYIAAGIRPEAIAVIAPRHRFLERLAPYLGRHSPAVPYAYERGDDILQSPIIMQLVQMARLVVAIHANEQAQTDQLLSEVLSYDFWELRSEDLIDVSLTCYNDHRHWLDVTLQHANTGISTIVQWLVRLSRASTTEPLEYMLDHLLGGLLEGFDNEADDLALANDSVDSFISPMREAYFSQAKYEGATDSYLTLLGQLSTLRQHIRSWLPNQTLWIADLVTFADLHKQAGVKIIDSNPHTQTTNAVQVMTAYKAKGLEFDVVFVINAQDEIWGPTARSRSSTISLPKNLPLAPASDSDNDKLRLLYVALTRAKQHLHVTSYSHTLDNKLSPPLSFISSLPLLQAETVAKPASVRAAAVLSTDWEYRFRQVVADKPTLFEPILGDYKLSVTHLNNFIDCSTAGPRYFLVHNLLRFPEAPTPAAAYGDAIHKTLQWAYSQLRLTESLPATTDITSYFSDLLSRKHLRASDERKLQERGTAALELYIKQRGKNMQTDDLIERSFSSEGVVIDTARLSGKIDKLHPLGSGQVSVVDYKTGKPAVSWKGKDEYEKIKLHKYRQQLLFYELLIVGSASYSLRVKVAQAELEFIEANDQGNLVSNLILDSSEAEMEHFISLIAAVWKHIMELNFPDTLKYPKTLKGIQAFEQDLIDEAI